MNCETQQQNLKPCDLVITCFIPPNGKKTERIIFVSEADYSRVYGNHLTLSMEMLSTGGCAVYALHPDMNEEDEAIELCAADKDSVEAAFSTVIQAAAEWPFTEDEDVV